MIIIERIRNGLLLLRVRRLLSLTRPHVVGVRLSRYDHPAWGWYLDLYVRRGERRYQETITTGVHSEMPEVLAAVRRHLLAQAVKFTGTVLGHQLADDPAWVEVGHKPGLKILDNTPA